MSLKDRRRASRRLKCAALGQWPEHLTQECGNNFGAVDAGGGRESLTRQQQEDAEGTIEAKHLGVGYDNATRDDSCSSGNIVGAVDAGVGRESLATQQQQGAEGTIEAKHLGVGYDNDTCGDSCSSDDVSVATSSLEDDQVCLEVVEQGVKAGETAVPFGVAAVPVQRAAADATRGAETAGGQAAEEILLPSVAEMSAPRGSSSSSSSSNQNVGAVPVLRGAAGAADDLRRAEAAGDQVAVEAPPLGVAGKPVARPAADATRSAESAGGKAGEKPSGIPLGVAVVSVPRAPADAPRPADAVESGDVCGDDCEHVAPDVVHSDSSDSSNSNEDDPFDREAGYCLFADRARRALQRMRGREAASDLLSVRRRANRKQRRRAKPQAVNIAPAADHGTGDRTSTGCVDDALPPTGNWCECGRFCHHYQICDACQISNIKQAAQEASLPLPPES